VPDRELLPKVTPYLLRTADVMCARRLAREFEGSDRSHDPVHRSRLRDAFLAAARDAHAGAARPVLARFDGIGAELEAEERRVLAQAARWYVEIFGDRAAEYHDHELDGPTTSQARGVRIGGWVDLAVTAADGTKELRQLDVWAGRAPVSDPLELDSVRVAVLRLSSWVGSEPLRVTWADLVHGVVRERIVDPGERPALVEWFESRLAVVRARAEDPVAAAGDGCGSCSFVAACPEHPTGAHFGRRRDHLPGIVTVTPTSLGVWRRCPREWHDHYVLQIPPSDGDPSSSHGEQLHAMLGLVHETGSCRDPAHVDDVLTAHGLDHDERSRTEIANHVRRCPEQATAIGHELTVARFHRLPMPMFMTTARIDALWVHDGVLDARDYKTGRIWADEVAHDEQARLQAYVLAPRANSLGLRVRIAFEHLAAEIVDDPTPFEPDDDDLTAIEEELRLTVTEIRTERFDGVSDPEVCVRCRYRSICPVSAAPSEPVWPVVDPDDAVDSLV
jgi:hypothetical protein